MFFCLRRGTMRISDLPAQAFRTKWLQAGFSSFAYRLAHFAPPWPLTAAGVSLLFYFS